VLHVEGLSTVAGGSDRGSASSMLQVPCFGRDFLMMQLGVVYKFVVDGNCASTANWDSSLVRRIPCPKWLFDVGTRRSTIRLTYLHTISRRPTMLRISNLSKTYSKGGVRAVDDLTIHVKAGEIFGFLGPNGAGKTTMIKMIVGLLNPMTVALSSMAMTFLRNLLRQRPA